MWYLARYNANTYTVQRSIILDQYQRGYFKLIFGKHCTNKILLECAASITAGSLCCPILSDCCPDPPQRGGGQLFPTPIPLRTVGASIHPLQTKILHTPLQKTVREEAHWTSLETVPTSRSSLGQWSVPIVTRRDWRTQSWRPVVGILTAFCRVSDRYWGAVRCRPASLNLICSGAGSLWKLARMSVMLSERWRRAIDQAAALMTVD